MKYGQRNYNDQRYDIDGVFHITSLSETMTETDATQIADAIKALSDSLSISDTIILGSDLFFFDLLFLDSTILIQFTNKALMDTVRMADWVSIKRNPAQNGWFD